MLVVLLKIINILHIVGYYAGSLTSGQYSTYLGAGAGRSVVGSNNVEVRAGGNGSSNSIIGSNSNKIHVYKYHCW